MAKIYPMNQLADRFNLDSWNGLSEKKTISLLRESMGLPPIEEGWTNCRRCQKRFITDFKYKRPIQHYCGICKSIQPDFLSEHGIGK